MEEELHEFVVDCSAQSTDHAACERPLTAAQRRAREILNAQAFAEDALRARRRDAYIRLREAARHDPRLADLLLVLMGEEL